MSQPIGSLSPAAIRGHEVADQGLLALELSINLLSQASQDLLASGSLKNAVTAAEGAREIFRGSLLESYVVELREVLEPLEKHKSESQIQVMKYVLSLWEDSGGED